MENRASLLRGGDSGPVVKVGQSNQSLLIELVSGHDPDRIMPEQGKRLSSQEINLLRKWIDQGLAWDGEISLRRLTLQTWKPRQVDVPNADQNAIDQLIDSAATATATANSPADPARFARRLSLDLVGLLPDPAMIQSLQPGFEKGLIDELLNDKHAYAQHWMTFWNDHLRNAYVGTGFIDGGRKAITNWLYQSLRDNKPYNKFVNELIAGKAGAEGFTKGIIWRGRVNASQRPPLQAAQTLSQVFLGLNLKCASCHDSFVSQWTLNDAYGLAAVFSDSELEIFRCDKPTGKKALPAFFNTEIGRIEQFAADKKQRQQQLADLLTNDNNARLSRTIVNRIWARLMGRGLIEPVDEMDNEAWNQDVLDWLANDLRDHNYDLKHTIRTIVTSAAYRRAAVSLTNADANEPFEFRGPVIKRMTAEQFLDAIWKITGTGAKKADKKRVPVTINDSPAFIRASMVISTPLMRSLGRPNREQVVTTRPAQLTTLQALDLTNGDALAGLIDKGAASLMKNHPQWSSTELLNYLYLASLSREPTSAETTLATQIIGDKPTAESVADLLWTIIMLPEFQLVL